MHQGQKGGFSSNQPVGGGFKCAKVGEGKGINGEGAACNGLPRITDKVVESPRARNNELTKEKSSK